MGSDPRAQIICPRADWESGIDSPLSSLPTGSSPRRSTTTAASTCSRMVWSVGTSLGCAHVLRGTGGAEAICRAVECDLSLDSWMGAGGGLHCWVVGLDNRDTVCKGNSLKRATQGVWRRRVAPAENDPLRALCLCGGHFMTWAKALWPGRCARGRVHLCPNLLHNMWGADPDGARQIRATSVACKFLAYYLRQGWGYVSNNGVTPHSLWVRGLKPVGYGRDDVQILVSSLAGVWVRAQPRA